MRQIFLFAVISTLLAVPMGTWHSSRIFAQEAAQPTAEQSTAPPIDLDGQVGELIDQLDADSFQIRNQSEIELRKLGGDAIAMLRKAVDKQTGERRLRLLRILQEFDRSVRLIDTVKRPELDCVTSVTISDDGLFLYAAAWKARTVSVFSRSIDTGRLDLIEAHSDGGLDGAISVRISPDGNWVAATSIRARSVVLFRRDQATGKLTKLQATKLAAKSSALAFPVEVAFSPDSRFLLVLDSAAMGHGVPGAVVVYRLLDDGRMQWTETNGGQQACFTNARGIVFHPQRNEFYVAAADPGMLSVVAWEPQTGFTFVKQIVRDEQFGVKGLSGVMSVATSSDGRFVYTSSGRFHGDNAVGVFGVATDGALSVIQEVIAGRDLIGQFLGGNELAVSGDGENVYATATMSSTLAGFARDSQTGELRHIETVALGRNKLGPAGICLSPDGHFIYVAVEEQASIAILQRE